MLSVIVPAKNESKHLNELISRLDACLPEDSEIVVVNNGSVDNSEETLSKLSVKKLVVLNLKTSGKTTAIKKGIEVSKGNIIATIDADLQYDPESVLTLYFRMGNSDFVNGWRDFSEYPFTKRQVSKVYNWIYRQFFRASIHDANCGLKIFTREVASDLIYREGYHRYFVAVASELGYKITEVSVPLHKSEKSSYGTGRIFKGIFDMISVKLSMTILKQPIIFFGTTSIVLIISGILYSLLERTWLPSIVIVSGFVAFMFGLLAEMIMNRNDEWRIEKK